MKIYQPSSDASLTSCPLTVRLRPKCDFMWETEWGGPVFVCFTGRRYGALFSHAITCLKHLSGVTRFFQPLYCTFLITATFSVSFFCTLTSLQRPWRILRFCFLFIALFYVRCFKHELDLLEFPCSRCKAWVGFGGKCSPCQCQLLS